MFTGCSLLLSGMSILAFSRVAFAHRIACNIQTDFSVDLTDGDKAVFHGSDLAISINVGALVVNSYQGASFHVRTTENIVVQFKGYMAFKGKDSATATAPQKITQTYKDRISGMAQLAPHASRSLKVDNCRLVLLPMEMDRVKMDYNVANKIQRLAESCLELEICPKIDDYPVDNDYKSLNAMSTGGAPFGAAADAWAYFNPHGSDEKVYSETIQLAINKAVDVGLSEAMESLVNPADGSIAIPNIDQSFPMTTGLIKTTAHFEAMDGTFGDLRTFRRTVDATVSHDKKKFMASCEFGLSVADVKFNRYTLKYTAVNLSGKLSGRIDGAAVKARIAVDYNHKRCVASVEYLKVTEFGKMTIDLTGLGPLSATTSKLINWITQTWRDDIVKTIETQMRSTIEAQLSPLDCEKFRP